MTDTNIMRCSLLFEKINQAVIEEEMRKLKCAKSSQNSQISSDLTSSIEDLHSEYADDEYLFRVIEEEIEDEWSQIIRGKMINTATDIQYIRYNISWLMPF